MFIKHARGLLATALAICAVSGGPAAGHPVDTPPGHTGGFGEPTCAECHTGYQLNPPDGALRLTAESDVFKPGRHYRLILELADPDMRRAGFELSARYGAGTSGGRDAGRLNYPAAEEAPADSLRLIRGDEGHLYLVHEAGGRLTRGDDPVRWQIEWTAPDDERPQCPVVFHAAANAGDDDESALGDRIYSAQLSLRPRSADRACRNDQS